MNKTIKKATTKALLNEIIARALDPDDLTILLDKWNDAGPNYAFKILDLTKVNPKE